MLFLLMLVVSVCISLYVSLSLSLSLCGVAVLKGTEKCESNLAAESGI